MRRMARHPDVNRRPCALPFRHAAARALVPDRTSLIVDEHLPDSLADGSA
jgi:hypothetical protein